MEWSKPKGLPMANTCTRGDRHTHIVKNHDLSA
jgi:hypothetical protein